jgi:hypothetical protein
VTPEASNGKQKDADPDRLASQFPNIASSLPTLATQVEDSAKISDMLRHQATLHDHDKHQIAERNYASV